MSSTKTKPKFVLTELQLDTIRKVKDFERVKP